MKKKAEIALSKRELDVMNVLWAEGRPLIASEIPERQPGLSINTVQAVLKIVQSGTVLSRSYAPLITPEEYAVSYMTTEIFPFGKSIAKMGFLSALFDSVDNDRELIEELEKFIQERKSQ